MSASTFMHGEEIWNSSLVNNRFFDLVAELKNQRGKIALDQTKPKMFQISQQSEKINKTINAFWVE